MIALPDGMRGRVLAVVLCGIVVAVLYGAMATPLLSAYRAREVRLEATIGRAEHLERSAAERPALREAANRLRARSDLNDLTLPGVSDSVATANLQALVTRLAASNGTAVVSTEILPVQVQEPYRRLAIRVTLAAEIAVVAALLRDMDEARPALFVNRFELRSGGGPIAAGTPGTPLSITLDVYGFRG